MITGHEISGVIQNYINSMWPGMNNWALPMMLAFFAFIAVIFLGIWIYTSLAYSEIAKKLKYKNPWLAWIPFARGAMVLQLGGFNWALIFLLLIPFVGWLAFVVLNYISLWRIFEKRKYPGWFALAPFLGVIPYLSLLAGLAFLVIIGLVAWKDQKGRK